MKPKTQGTLASIAISIIIGGFIGSAIIPEIWMRIFFAAYFALIGLGTGLVISWDKAEGITRDYFSYVFYGALTFAVLDIALGAWSRGFPPKANPALLIMLFAIGALQGLAYRYAAMRALKLGGHNE